MANLIKLKSNTNTTNHVVLFGGLQTITFWSFEETVVTMFYRHTFNDFLILNISDEHFL